MTWRLGDLRCAWAAKPHDTSETVKSEVVSIADIEGAERLVGIAYTPAEREQMVGNFEGQIASAIARRKLRFDNSAGAGFAAIFADPGPTLACG
jgi:class 3 adenylate cyclase